MSDNQEIKCIYNLACAGYLMMNHCPIIRVEKNAGRPWRDVYIFKNTEKVNQLIQQYKAEKSKENENGINNENSSSSTDR